MPLRKKGYRDMDKFRRTRNRQKRRYAQRTGSGQYSPRPWNVKEDEIVLKHAMPDRKIAEFLHRSVQAVQTRRWKLKGSEIDEVRQQ